jgi:hypothetical protein
VPSSAAPTPVQASSERTIREFIDAHNDEAKPFVWRKSADKILASITPLRCPDQ